MPYDENDDWYESDGDEWEDDYYYEWDEWDYAQNYSFREIATHELWSRRLKARLIALKVWVQVRYVCRAARHTYRDLYYKITGKRDPRLDIPF